MTANMLYSHFKRRVIVAVAFFYHKASCVPCVMDVHNLWKTLKMDIWLTYSNKNGCCTAWGYLKLPAIFRFSQNSGDKFVQIYLWICWLSFWLLSTNVFRNQWKCAIRTIGGVRLLICFEMFSLALFMYRFYSWMFDGRKCLNVVFTSVTLLGWESDIMDTAIVSVWSLNKYDTVCRWGTCEMGDTVLNLVVKCFLSVGLLSWDWVCVCVRTFAFWYLTMHYRWTCKTVHFLFFGYVYILTFTCYELRDQQVDVDQNGVYMTSVYKFQCTDCITA